MTYPVDDRGNPRVDFVWGNMAMQPNDQRDVVTSGPEPLIPANGEGNFGWDATYKYPSEGLTSTVTQRLSVGDQNINANWIDGVTYRTVEIPADNHNVALTGYQNYPAYEPNYAGDGDTDIETFVIMPNLAGLTTSAANALIGPLGFPSNVMIVNTTKVGATTVNDGKIQSQEPLAGVKTKNDVNVNVQTYNAPEVPNVVGLTEAAATTALTNAGLVKGAVTTADNAGGATSENNNLIKSATPAVGTTVNTGSTVALVKYAYTAPVANTNIAGFSQASFPGHEALTGTDIYMFLTGRVTKPTALQTITVANSINSSLNRNYIVQLVEDNDSYNTGGTVVTLAAVGGGAFTDPATSTGATWVVA